MSFKYNLFKEMFKMSSSAAQKASTKSFQIFSTFAVVDPTQPTKNWKISTQPNPTHGSTQPMDNSGFNSQQNSMTNTKKKQQQNSGSTQNY